ncbi:MAG: hypothetical protein ACI376_04485 [Candidatus Bruticola sp.]
MKKSARNIFGFVALALTVGLMGAGCSDSGDGESGPSYKVGRVTFEYSLQASKRTEIPNTASSVKYSFLDSKNSTVFLSKVYQIPHQSTEVKQASLTVNEVPIAAQTVVAAYYDENNTIVDIGLNDIEWTSAYTASVANPEIKELKNVEIVSCSGSGIFTKGSSIALDTAITIGDAPEKLYRVTDFVSFKEKDQNVSLKPIKSSEDHSLNSQVTAGCYEADKYGTYDISAVLPVKDGDIIFNFDTLTVSDNTISYIKLVPSVGTLYEADDSCEVIVPDIYLGTDKVTKADTDYNTAVSKESFKVMGVYTDDTSKGPQPDPQDFTEQASLKCNLSTASIDKNTVTFKNLEANQTVKVTAEVKLPGTAEAKTDSIDVKLSKGYAELLLGMRTDNGEYTDLDSAIISSYVDFNLSIVNAYLDNDSHDLNGRLSNWLPVESSLVPEYPTPHIAPAESAAPYFELSDDKQSYDFIVDTKHGLNGNYVLSVDPMEKLPGFDCATSIIVDL